jgi:hypothetical protein
MLRIITNANAWIIASDSGVLLQQPPHVRKCGSGQPATSKDVPSALMRRGAIGTGKHCRSESFKSRDQSERPFFVTP